MRINIAEEVRTLTMQGIKIKLKISKPIKQLDMPQTPYFLHQIPLQCEINLVL